MEDSRENIDTLLGKNFTDEVTGFSGVATSYLVSDHTPTLVHLENEQASRWIEITRLQG